MRRSLGIVYPYPHPDSNPTLANVCAELKSRGWSVELFCAGGDAGADSLVPDNAPSFFNPVPRLGGGLASRLAGRVRRALAPALYSRTRRHALLVGVDPSGLVMAGALNARARLPLVYISFEIMFPQELGVAERGLKDGELAVCPEVELVLVQDEERAGALAGATGLDRDLMSLVPNAPLPEPVQQSDFLRRRLGIPAEKRIVLYSGTLSGWSSLHLLGEMVRGWPERFTLVLHSRAAASARMAAHLERLERTGRIVISPEPVPAERLNELYASADYALAPYMPVPDDWTSGANIHHLGLSSGKVAHAALCGLPLLASDLPVFRHELPEFRCGEIYESVTQTGALLEKMDAEYEAYAAGARRFYAERLDPRAAVASFCDRLEGLVR